MLSPKEEHSSINDLRVGRSTNLNLNSSVNRSPNRSANRRYSMNSYNFDNYNMNNPVFSSSTTTNPHSNFNNSHNQYSRDKNVKHKKIKPKDNVNNSRHMSQAQNQFHSQHNQQNQTDFKQLNNEQLIDIMEKEQDAIVLKLSKEIVNLKDEIKFLKSNNFMHSRSNSFSRSHSSSISSVSNGNPNTNNRNSISNINTQCFLNNDPASIDPKTIKPDSTNDINYIIPRSFDGHLDHIDNNVDIIKENQMLKAKILELQRKLLQSEIEVGK